MATPTKNRRPSDVNLKPIRLFGEMWQDAITAYLLGFLADNHLDWKTEIPWFKFAQWVEDDNRRKCSVHADYAYTLWRQPTIVPGLKFLLGEGCLTQQDRDDCPHLTDAAKRAGYKCAHFTPADWFIDLIREA